MPLRVPGKGRGLSTLGNVGINFAKGEEKALSATHQDKKEERRYRKRERATSLVSQGGGKKREGASAQRGEKGDRISLS